LLFWAHLKTNGNQFEPFSPPFSLSIATKLPLWALENLIMRAYPLSLNYFDVTVGQSLSANQSGEGKELMCRKSFRTPFRVNGGLLTGVFYDAGRKAEDARKAVPQGFSPLLKGFADKFS
jgi:hypothetical protein